MMAIRFILIGWVLVTMTASIAHAETLELGYPVKTLDNAEISVYRFTLGSLNGKCWSNYYEGRLCVFPGILLAHASIKNAEDVNFLGVNLFAQFQAGPFWSRYGVGLGLFDKTTKEIRSSWDVNLSIQLGAIVYKRVGCFLGWDHLSNGRSFAVNLGLEKYWPSNNDGGNTLIAGCLVFW